MRSIFLSNAENLVRSVYSPELTARLEKSAHLSPDVVSSDELARRAGDFDDVRFVFSTWGMPALTGDEIARCLPSLECVFYAAGTVQGFARPFLERGVRVFSSWRANAVPVAEFASSLILLSNKRFFAASRRYGAGDRPGAVEALDAIRGNYGAPVGVLGAGAIGTLVIERLGADLDVRVFDPFLSDERAAALGVRKMTLGEIFAECGVVSCHLADNDGTRKLLRREHFAAMRPWSTFINTGRGATVVEDDLCAVLAERPDLTAILDVTFPEPVAPDGALVALPNAVLTPHIAGSIGDETRRMGEYAAAYFDAYLRGESADGEVTPDMLATMA